MGPYFTFKYSFYKGSGEYPFSPCFISLNIENSSGRGEGSAPLWEIFGKYFFLQISGKYLFKYFENMKTKTNEELARILKHLKIIRKYEEKKMRDVQE